MKKTDIFVLPSHFEGMPNSLLEAMAYGKACVASDVGAVRDLITTPTVGRVVPPRDPLRLSEALVELAESRKIRTELGDAAKAHIVEHNNARTQANKIVDILRLVSGRGM